MSAAPPASSPAPDSDEALVAGFVAGDVAAFELLVQRHSRPIFNFAYRMINNATDAEDVAQDIFVQVYRALPKARTDLPFRPWLYVVARNKCLDFLKRKRPLLFSDTAAAGDDSDDPAARVPDTDPLPDELAERADLQRILSAAIAQLPPAYAEVVALRYTGDLSFAEIGAVLDCDEGAARVRFHRAKALLRRHLRASIEGD